MKDMYSNKLTRFIGHTFYMLGAYSGDYNETPSQVFDNIKKYGIFSPIRSYYYNSGIHYWLNGEDSFMNVIKRIFSTK
ncbi:MAG: hypothetical protein WC449_05085 [Candidatus Paceibacterota bacterium]